MSVGSLSSHNVATIDPGASVTDAARRLREAHVGDLVVVETRQGVPIPVGIVTDRDLVIEVLAAGVDPEALKVADIMSRDLVTAQEDSSLEFALREMRRMGLRRLPVVDRKGALVGILSIDDVIEHMARLAGHIADAIRIEQHMEVKKRP